MHFISKSFMTDEIWEQEILKSSGSFQKRDHSYLEVFQIVYGQTDWLIFLWKEFSHIFLTVPQITAFCFITSVPGREH